MSIRFLQFELSSVTVKTLNTVLLLLNCMLKLVFASIAHVHGIYSESPLNTRTRIIKTISPVPWVFILTRFHHKMSTVTEE